MGGRLRSSLARTLEVALVWACVSGCAHDKVRAQAAPKVIQEPLGARAREFAGYVIAMHRRIHHLFTDGFLADIDARKDPQYSDQALWTELEIAINSDGSVDHIGSRRRSGERAFDAAAIDSVLAAAPFPPPPQAIRSGDGKLYVDWQFHRDERACGAFGVTPHIYTTAGDESDRSVYDAVRSARAQWAERRQSDASAARLAADGWLSSYVRGDVAWLAGWSALPFTADGEVIARDAATLKQFYGELIAAAPAERAVTAIEILTPSEIRRMLGRLPPGGEPSDMLYAVGHGSGVEVTLLLKKSSQGWRVCGLDRRAAEPARAESNPQPSSVRSRATEADVAVDTVAYDASRLELTQFS